MNPSKLPRQSDTGYLGVFEQYVQEDTYHWWTSSEMPVDMLTVGANCQAVLIAAFIPSSTGFDELPEPMQPAGPAFFWRGFRTIPGESPPRKVDEAIFYMGLGGKAWRIHSNESSDHWNYVMSSSGVDGLMQDWYLPAQRFGSLGSLLAHSTGINPMAPFDALEDSDATT